MDKEKIVMDAGALIALAERIAHDAAREAAVTLRPRLTDEVRTEIIREALADLVDAQEEGAVADLDDAVDFLRMLSKD